MELPPALHADRRRRLHRLLADVATGDRLPQLVGNSGRLAIEEANKFVEASQQISQTWNQFWAEKDLGPDQQVQVLKDMGQISSFKFGCNWAQISQVTLS